MNTKTINKDREQLQKAINNLVDVYNERHPQVYVKKIKLDHVFNTTLTLRKIDPITTVEVRVEVL